MTEKKTTETNKEAEANAVLEAEDAAAKLKQAQTDAARLAELEAKAKAQAELAIEAEMKKKLREQAKVLGIDLPPNASIDTMLQRLVETPASVETRPADVDPDAANREARNKLYDELMAMRRVRISCLDPSKAGVPGEVFTVYNGVVGSIAKYIPYQDFEDGYHIPEIMYRTLKERTYLQIKSPPKGSRKPATRKLVPMFNLVELPPLTKEELDSIAAIQAAEGSGED